MGGLAYNGGMATQAVVDQVRTRETGPWGTLGAAALIGFVLLASLLLTAGRAAADPSGGEGYPQPSVELSDSPALLVLDETHWLTLTLTNDGSERTESWGVQVRVSDGLALVEEPAFPWSATLCDHQAVSWLEEIPLDPGEVVSLGVGIKGLTVSARETISYTAWMTDSDGEPQPVQYAHPYEGDPCDRGYAKRQVAVTETLTTKSLRARAIQTATHESIGDFLLPADLPQAEREAIILSVAAQESGGHEFDNEMVTAGWSRGVMQITSDYYVGAGSGGCADEDEDCANCRDRVDTEACYRYYRNTLDGITRNVRDGLYALEDKHGLGYPDTWESVDLGFGDPVTAAEMKWMFALKRYGPNYDAVKPFHYVRLIGKLLEDALAAHYDHQPTYPELGQKLSHAYGQIISSSGPADLRARDDSQDRVTGRVGEEIKQGLPNAWYNPFANRITALFPADPLYYQIGGREDGAYGLRAVAEPHLEAGSWPDGFDSAASFALMDVPIHAGAVHQYLVDWESGGKIATRWIDADGGGFGEPITIYVPEASFTVEPASPHSGDWVTFDGSTSSHPGDNIVSYHWDFGDGGRTDAGPRVDYRYMSPGSYTVRLTVREEHGAVDTASAVLTVIFEVTDVVYIPLVLK
ncbi:MAG: PKD domain-containing protein [Chloroflexota bacterium]